MRNALEVYRVPEAFNTNYPIHPFWKANFVKNTRETVEKPEQSDFLLSKYLILLCEKFEK